MEPEYRQKRCPHGWVDVGQCEACAQTIQYRNMHVILLNVALFLEDLPQDLGRGSLNGLKAQLQQKIADLTPNV